MNTMTVLIIAVLVLSVLLSICIYVIMRCVSEIGWLRDDVQQAHDTDHAKCMAGVMAFIGNEWAAQILEIAANDYASVDSHQDRDRIGRLLYKPGGPPIPSLWLRERATRLRIEADWGVGPVADAARLDHNDYTWQV